MKLERISLPDYQVLQEFAVEFSHEDHAESYGLDFLVGVNGTGKSTLLRAVAALFRGLERNGSVAFPFDITYRMGGRRIHLSKHNRTAPVRVTIDRQQADLGEALLPEYVICFTTGREDGWLEPVPGAFSEPDVEQVYDSTVAPDSLKDRFLAEQPLTAVYRPRETPIQLQSAGRVRLIRSDRIPLIMAFGWLADQAAHFTVPAKPGKPDESPLTRVLKEAGFSAPAGFSLRLRVRKPLLRSEDLADLEVLASEYATRSVRQGADRLLFFDLQNDSRHLLTKRPDRYRSFLDLFLFLDRLSAPCSEDGQPVLQEVSVFINRPGDPENKAAAPDLQLFSSLSDGEQNFLGRMALFSLLHGQEALILIDEPEVHFNDFWKRRIVHLLDASLRGSNSHVLMTTHSSITLTDVPRQRIRVLERGPRFTNVAKAPEIQTFGASPGDIVVGVFQAEYATGEHVSQEVSRLLHEIESASLDISRKYRLDLIRRVKALLNTVAPGYWSYRLLQALMSLED